MLVAVIVIGWLYWWLSWWWVMPWVMVVLVPVEHWCSLLLLSAASTHNPP